MDVVTTKKRINVSIIVAVVIAAAVAVGAAILGTKKDKNEYKEKKIENYFSEDNSFILPPEIVEVHKMISEDDGLLMEAYVNGKGAVNYVSVYDSENDTFTDLDMNGIEGDVYKMHSGEKYLWVAVTDDENSISTLVRYNAETYKEEGIKNLEYGEYISDITENEDGSSTIGIFRTDSDNHITEWSFCSVDSSLNETERKIVFDDNTFSEDILLNTCVRNEKTGEYYLFYTSLTDQKLSMHKYSADGTELYHRNDIAADMNGYTSGWYLNHNGDPVVMSYDLDRRISAELQQQEEYQFNEFDAETGEVCNRYNLEIEEYIPWLGGSSWNYNDDYDFVWVNDSKLYGFITGYESPELIKDLKECGSRYEMVSLISSGNGSLMISGLEPDSMDTGYYMLKTDISGNIKSKKFMPSSDIEVIKHGNDGQVYAVVAEHESVSKRDILTDKFSLCTVDSNCIFRNAVPLEIDNAKMPIIKDLAVTENAAVILIESGNGNPYGNEILCFDRKGKLNVRHDIGKINSSCVFEKEGNIYAVCSSDENSYIYMVNTEKSELNEVVKLDFSTDHSTVFNEGNDQYDFFVTFYDGIYGYNMEKNTLSEFVNWIDSDIYFSQLEGLCITDENRIMLECMNHNEDENIELNITSFVRVDDETLKKIQNRKLINAVFISSPDESIFRIFRDYNQNSTEYRIHIDDYSKYNEADNIFGLSSHLDSEIIKGNIPDLIFAGSKFDWIRYSSGGMFENIENFMNNDPEFNRSLYFENIIDAFSFDGRQFAVPLEFKINALTAKKSVTGDKTGYTIDELSELAESRKLFSGVRRRQMLDSFVLSNISEYADFKKGECSFDTPELVKLLNLIKEQGISDEEVIDFADLETGISEDKYMFNNIYLFDFRWAATEQQILVGEEASYTGIPSASESRPLVVSELAAGITTSSKTKNEAWNIIKLMLSDDIQSNIHTGGYSVSRSVFESEAQAEMRNSITDSWPLSNGKNIKIKKIDKKSVDNIRNAVERTETAALYDSGTAKIIDEEYSAFIDGVQSAKETAKNIQSKVSLYLKEVK